MMAHSFSQKKPGLNPNSLADAMISAYVKNRRFPAAIIAAGVSREEARSEERNAVLVLHRLTANALGPQAKAVAVALTHPK